VIDNLNQFIKHREDFHPFVLSVPSERAAEFFDATANCRFAASIGRLRSTESWLRPFALTGGRVRLHVVDQASNPRFHALLTRFGQTAPAPVLVNTSFNLCGEPLVADPRTAVRTVYCCGIDAMVIGDFLLTK
jgi:carbamoyltransferase